MYHGLHFFPFLILLFSFVGCDKSGDWELTWSEEFDYNGKPNEAFWDYEQGYIRNNELQYYSDQIRNAKVENGYCTIQAILKAEEGDLRKGYSEIEETNKQYRLATIKWLKDGLLKQGKSDLKNMRSSADRQIYQNSQNE